MDLPSTSYNTTMNLAMEYTSSDAVLDLRKIREEKPIHIPQPMKYSPLPEPLKYTPEPIKYSSTPPINQAYAPLTPPYYGTPPYQTSMPTMPEGSSSPPTPTPAALVTSSYLMTSNVINAGRSGKPTRPFKAYPKDPLALSSFHDSTEEYIEFRQRMLAQLELVSGRNNSNMRRSNSPQQPSSTAELDDKTAAYWERRRKNNEAAKRSRDARRAKEDEIAIRAAFLEQENIKLKYELATLRTETAKLRHLVYNR